MWHTLELQDKLTGKDKVKHGAVINWIDQWVNTDNCSRNLFVYERWKSLREFNAQLEGNSHRILPSFFPFSTTCRPTVSAFHIVQFVYVTFWISWSTYSMSKSNLITLLEECLGSLILVLKNTFLLERNHFPFYDQNHFYFD